MFFQARLPVNHSISSAHSASGNCSWPIIARADQGAAMWAGAPWDIGCQKKDCTMADHNFSDAILKPKHADKSTTKRFSWTLSSAVFADAPRMFMGGITTNWSINFPTKTFQAQTGESANGLTLYITVAPSWKESKGN